MLLFITRSKEMKKYSIVEFPDDDEPYMEMVPSSWVTSKDTCLWPPENEIHDLNSMIRKCVPPVQRWRQIRIKILGGSNTFLRANQKVEDAKCLSSIGSDSSDDDSRPNRKRVRRVPFRYRNENEYETAKYSGNEAILTNLKKRKRQTSQPTVVYTLAKPSSDNSITMKEDVERVEHLSPITSKVVPEDTLVPEIQRSSTPIERASSSDFLHTDSIPEELVLQKILSKLIVIEKENKELRKEVKTLRETVEKVELKLTREESPEVSAAVIGKIVDEEYRNLPLANQSELQVLEKEVTKSSYKATSLARFLCRGGGFNDAKTLTLLIMKRLLSRDVAMLYSLEGRQKKLKFNELNLFLVVIASVKMQFPQAGNKEIGSRVGTVLARSGDWDGNRVRNKKRASQDGDNSTKSVD